MIVRNINDSEPFVTKDGSSIRSILDGSNAPVRRQSLAEATVPPGGSTQGHRHKTSEEIYYFLAGYGTMTVAGERREVRPFDAVLTPPDTYHQVTNTGDGPLVFLCCSAPPYAHTDTVLEGD